jgi:hypothetical protein
MARLHLLQSINFTLCMRFALNYEIGVLNHHKRDVSHSAAVQFVRILLLSLTSTSLRSGQGPKVCGDYFK